jgi:hypothetical protein
MLRASVLDFLRPRNVFDVTTDVTRKEKRMHRPLECLESKERSLLPSTDRGHIHAQTLGVF